MGTQSTFEQVANNAQSTLNGSITNVATTINVASGHGARFPSPGNGFYATIWDSATYADPFADSNMEIVKVTARSTDALTVTRAQRGTSAVAHSSGVDIHLLADSELVSDLQTAVNNIEGYAISDRGGVGWHEDFDTVQRILGASTTGVVGRFNYQSSSSSGAQIVASSTYGSNSRPGIIHLDTEASGTSYVTLLGNPEAYTFGGGVLGVEWGIYIPTLSTAGEEFYIRAGFGDATNAADSVDGAYLEYVRATSVNWQRKTANNSSRTANASSTAVGAASWLRLGVEANAAGTTITYYVNGASIGTETTNIPTSRYFGPWLQYQKAAGTTSRPLAVDYCKVYQQLTSSR